MYDLMIIGGGPAGIAASVYDARKRLNAVLIRGDIGWQVSKTLDIENYLGFQLVEGPELIDKFQTQISKYPIEQKIGEKITRLDEIEGGFEATSETGGKYQARAVIFTAGKSPRKLNVPGEAEYTGKGVTYCAICDGPLFAGQKVAVVGGGNSALEAALDMVKIAEYVNLVSLTQLTGDAILIDRLKDAKNLTIYLEHRAEEIEGQEFVQRLFIRDLKTGQSKQLDVGGVFVEIGLVPNSDAVRHLIKLNELGEVPVDCATRTEVPGLFAAGDVTSVPEKQIIVAAGEGAKAALQAHRYLQHLAK
ncbi:MAG: FAD-dependent oxidoreductase [Chloroflexi bacterium]|nr:FAD-dependent oxidoreductase [Chloroflexota bacterium]